MKLVQKRILLAERTYTHGERQMLRGFHTISGERNWLVLNVQTTAGVTSAIDNWDPHVCVVGSALLANTPPEVWGNRLLIGININASKWALASVRPDDFAVGAEAARHLLEKGFRKFATVQLTPYPWSEARVAAFREAVLAAGAEYVAEGILDGERTDLADATSRWARTLPTGTAILAGCDEWGAILILACQIAGIAVPEELAVMGVDDDDLVCEMCQPHLSSVRIPWQEIGLAVGKMVDRFLRTGRRPSDVKAVPPAGVVERRSTELLAVGHPVVAQALSYMRDRAHEEVSVNDVVEHLTVNRRWLERTFRTHLGRSILQEIRRAHMDRARRLLATTRLSIPDIARGCGVGDAHARFTRTFHKEVGMTPTDYRRKFTLHR